MRISIIHLDFISIITSISKKPSSFYNFNFCPSVINDIKLIQLEALKVGLSLNHLKCEIICSESSSCQALHDAGLFFSVRSPLSADLLGTPLDVDGVEDAVRVHVAAFSRAVPHGSPSVSPMPEGFIPHQKLSRHSKVAICSSNCTLLFCEIS